MRMADDKFEANDSLDNENMPTKLKVLFLTRS